MGIERASISSKKSSIILDNNLAVSSFLLQLNNSATIFADDTQNVGIGTMINSKKLTISCSNDDGIRLINPNTMNHGSIHLLSDGTVQFNSTNNLIQTVGNFDIINHDGSTNGLFLDGSLVQSSALELNYLYNVAQGTAIANKALVLDSNKDISTIRNLTADNLYGTIQTAAQPNIISLGSILNIGTTNITTSAGITTFTASTGTPSFVFAGGPLSTSTPILPPSGGTGISTYSKGDILVAANTTTLDTVSIPAYNGYVLQTDPASALGISWGMSNMKFVKYFDSPTYVTNTSYVFGRFYGTDNNQQANVIVSSAATNIDLTTTGLNGVNISNIKTGTIYPDPTTLTITGTGTLFTSEVSVGDFIKIGSELRKVLSITNDTTLIVDLAYTLVNRWTLGPTGTIITNNFKFGAAAFNGANATTSNVTLTMGSPNLNFIGSATAWTLEFFVRITNTSAQTIFASSTANTLRLSMANSGGLTLFLGQGSSFNIANGSAISGNLSAGTYFHIALVYNGTNYVVYKNGTAALTITNSTKITTTAFNSIIFGGSAAAFNGQLDEIRLSSNARYSTTFIPTTGKFMIDANTLALNHFETTSSVTLSDDNSISANNQFSYLKGGGLYANTVFYGYAISNADSSLSGYIFSASASAPELPPNYTTYASLPFYIPVNGFTVPYPVFYNTGHYISIGTSIPLLTGATNTTPTNTSLTPYLPATASSVELLVTHAHLTNISCGITIGNNSLGIVRTVLTTNVASTIQLVLVAPLATNSIDTFLTTTAGGTTYSVSIIGVYL